MMGYQMVEKVLR